MRCLYYLHTFEEEKLIREQCTYSRSGNSKCFYNILHTWGQVCLPPCLCLVQASSCYFKEEKQQEGKGNQHCLAKDEGDEGSHSSAQGIKDCVAFHREEMSRPDWTQKWHWYLQKEATHWHLPKIKIRVYFKNAAPTTFGWTLCQNIHQTYCTYYYWLVRYAKKCLGSDSDHTPRTSQQQGY